MPQRDWRYTRGLHPLGTGVYAWLQPDGGWGWSNAGLIEDSGVSLLIDTLFDERLTAEMLRVMFAATGTAPSDIKLLVNTHANGDHTHGNALVENATIIASRAGAAEMAEVTPQLLAEMMRTVSDADETGAYLKRIFGRFDFEHSRGKAPELTFSGLLDLKVGDLDVKLEEVGPAHTSGDVIVHVPARKLVFTGDILFVDSTPIIWAGSVRNWIRACDRILSLGAETIVPGHGPLTDAKGVARVQAYLRYIDAEARKRFAAGLDVLAAAMDIALADYDSWGDAERIVANVDALYREYRSDPSPPDAARLFDLMARVDRARRRPCRREPPSGAQLPGNARPA